MMCTHVCSTCITLESLYSKSVFCSQRPSGLRMFTYTKMSCDSVTHCLPTTFARLLDTLRHFLH